MNLISMLNRLQSFHIMHSRIIPHRTFKNFGHKREPLPLVTVLWHGFLTFTFISIGIEWKRIGKFLFGLEEGEVISLMDSLEDQKKVFEKKS